MLRNIRIEIKECADILLKEVQEEPEQSRLNGMDPVDTLYRVANKLTVLNQAVYDPESVMTGFFSGMRTMLIEFIQEIINVQEILNETYIEASKAERAPV